MPEYIFKAILITSLIGTTLTLLLTVIKPITLKFFSSRWNYYVWLVVLIAMIVPFRFAEPEATQQSETYTFYLPMFHALVGLCFIYYTYYLFAKKNFFNVQIDLAFG